MYYRDFRKMFKDLNPHLKRKILDECAECAFLQADLNQDKAISFDEFVNWYTMFQANKYSYLRPRVVYPYNLLIVGNICRA